jgi:TolB-like protein
MALLTELKQRKVLRVAGTYAVIAWLLIQVSATVGPVLNLPEWTSTFVTVLLILGFPAAVVLAWTYDVVRTGKPAPREASGIAVLPFANLTGDVDQGHLADGIVEDLLTRLQASRRIRVVSRQSSHSYKDRVADARTIARELGCRYVVEGSVRKVGDHVHVTAQLIDAPADPTCGRSATTGSCRMRLRCRTRSATRSSRPSRPASAAESGERPSPGSST